MKMHQLSRISLAVVLVTCTGLVPMPLARAQAQADQQRAAKIEQFDELLGRVRSATAEPGEAEVMRLLEISRELGRDYAAALAVKSYLSRHFDSSPELTLAAAETARRGGDLSAAISRYKSYLRDAKPSQASSEAAAKLYRAQLQLRKDADAYASMKQFGDAFRQSPEARQYDRWFLFQADRRHDYPAWAERLSTILDERMPLEAERAAVWDDIDRLMRELTRNEESMYGAVQPARKIAEKLRDDRRRARRFAFIAENLAYAATYAAKDEQARQRDFQNVARAALEYIKADPTADALKDVVITLASGYRDREHDFRRHFDGAWNVEGDQRQALFAKAYRALKNDDERGQLIGWRYDHMNMTDRLASPQQWADLAAAHPGAVAKAVDPAQLPIVIEADSADVWKRQAKSLQSVISTQAAVVRALAAGNGQLQPTLEHLLGKEGWSVDAGAFSAAIEKQIWPAIASLHRQTEQKLGDDALDKALLAVGKRITASPAAVVDRDLARRYLLAAWRQAGQQYDRKAVADHLQALDWVAWSKEHRQEVIEPAHREFRQWAEQMRQEQEQATKALGQWQKRLADAEAAVEKHKDQIKKLAGEGGKDDQIKAERQKLDARRKAVEEAGAKVAELEPQLKQVESAVAQIAPIDEAFKRSLDPAVANQAKAPDKLAGSLSDMLAAINAKDQKAYDKAAREAYKHVREFEARQTPFGAAALDMVLANRAPFKSLDLQLQMLADQLDRWKPGFDDRAIGHTLSKIVGSHRHVGFGNTRKGERAIAVAISNTLEEALSSQIDNNRFYDRGFAWLREFRRGYGWEGWRGDDQNTALMKKMVEQQTLLKTSDYRVESSFAAPSYQWLVENRWDDLREQYPPDRYFDDMFLAEARNKKWLDPTYLRYGDDRSRKVANFAAEWFASQAKLPLPYGDKDASPMPAWGTWRWQRHALQAHAEPREQMLARIDSAWGKTRYDAYAMGLGYLETASDRQIAEEQEARDAYFQRLRTYVDRARQRPLNASVPPLRGINRLPSDSITDEELGVLLSVVEVVRPDAWDEHKGHKRLADVLLENLNRRQRYDALLELAPVLWRIGVAEHRDDLKQRLLGWTQGLLKKDRHDLAVVYASVGLDVLGSKADTEFQTDLRNIQARANANVSGVIPVARGDRRYPLFVAQADFLSGKTQSAWKGYQENGKLLLEHYQQFDPTFLLWLVRRNTELSNYAAAEELAQLMRVWFEQRAAAVDPELKGRLRLAHADIAFARKEYPKARAAYQSVAEGEEYDDTRAQQEARIMVAEVYRMTGRYDEATQLLEKMIRRSESPDIRGNALYHLALVQFDQEEYAEAADVIKEVFIEVPNHALARILLANVNLRLQKIEEATDVPIGLDAEKQFIVPGKVLKVGMEDPNLSVVGQSSVIELRAWTDSGDEELFTLTPFGDSKTRFRGELMTELAPIATKDGRLQVLGNERVYYDFSEAFRAANNVSLEQPKSLQVVSSANLLASTGEILSEEEKRERELELRLRRTLEDAPARGHRRGRRGDIVKPGNRINVRVVDADQSKTAEVDRLPIRVTASSGDIIGELMLEETDPHSGIFEGVVQTAAGSAIAYASDSADGRNPNFAISAADYPAWVALRDAQKPKWFSVDLNDRIRAGGMHVTAAEPGRKITRFLVEVSPNGSDYQVVGQYPGDYKPWDGSPRVEVVSLHDADLAKDPQRLLAYIRSGHMTRTQKKIVPIKAPAINWDWGTVRRHGGGSWNAFRMRVAFYQNERRVRQFKIKSGSDRTTTYLYINGQRVESNRDGTVFRASLERGVHTVEVVAAAWRDVDFQVMTDHDEPPFERAMTAEDVDPASSEFITERISREPARITANEDGTEFSIQFGDDTFMRVARLTILDYQTDAPAINRIALSDTDGRKILPTEQDFMELRKNQTLEIVPGDEVRITYRDPLSIEASDELHQAFLEAAYTDAEVMAAFIQATGRAGNRELEEIELRRFEPGDAVALVIVDPDMDVSERQDTVAFTITTDTGDTVTLEALETGPYSGRFVGRFFPISGEPQRESELPVEPGEGMRVTYLDKHNTDPGVPWERVVNLEQVTWVTPELRVYQTTSTRLPREQVEQIIAQRQEEAAAGTDEFIPPRYSLLVNRPMAPQPEGPTPSAMALPVTVELLWPTLAKSPRSTATLYVQTSTAREQAGKADDAPFDITVPGTIKLGTAPTDLEGMKEPRGYATVNVRGDMYATDPVSDGRFTFTVPMELGSPGDASHAVEGRYDDPRGEQMPPLAINGGDTVHVGFRYVDPDGTEQWITRKVDLYADPLMDVMERRYREIVRDIQVGQTLYFRVIDAEKDLTDEKDAFNLSLTTESGAQVSMRMSETFSHSGIFKGLIEVAHRDETTEVGAEAEDAGDAEADDGAGEAWAEGDALPADAVNLAMSVPVIYGDTIQARYAPGREHTSPIEHSIYVRKGDEGLVLAFTKRFQDPEIAVQTQFTMAEAFFELAKRHRELGNEDLARVKVLQGKKLLEEALAEFTDTSMRAQAEYLLANLSMEFGDDAKNTELKKRFYNEAVSRFSDLVASYPDNEYAPKAQYKKALVYEKMSEFQPSLIDKASEEYVKLSYRYPDHELVADTIVRLGEYFRNKGRAMRDQANALAEQGQAVEAEKIRIQARKMFVTGSRVLGRLSERFPQHGLAGKTLVVSGQCAMQGEDYELAVEMFDKVIEDTQMQSDLRAMAMFWSGRAHLEQKDLMQAYIDLKKLTWDYPETEWARYARGLLATNEGLIKMDEQN